MNVNVNNRSASGSPIFVEACKNAEENAAMCQMLLEHGADPNGVDEASGKSALHNASACGCVQVARAILEKGANPNIVDKRKQTPAHSAAIGGHFNVINLSFLIFYFSFNTLT
jgi:ankyrin repeat protein